MLKVMGLVLILTAAVGTGYSISKELSLREKNLRQYLMLIISLKGEIRYGNSSLAEAFQRTVPRLQGPVRELAEKLAKEKGASRLDLMVWDFNHSTIDFYRAMGMTPQRYIFEKNL